MGVSVIEGALIGLLLVGFAAGVGMLIGLIVLLTDEQFRIGPWISTAEWHEIKKRR